MKKIFRKFKTITIGNLSKDDLLQALSDNKIGLNVYAMRILTHKNFRFTKEKRVCRLVLVNAGDFGFKSGATLDELFKQAQKYNLELCPMDLALYLRIKYIDQPEGAIRIAMKKISKEVDFPDGFYLRKENGYLWLRAHKAQKDYKWENHQQFVFVKSIT